MEVVFVVVVGVRFPALFGFPAAVFPRALLPFRTGEVEEEEEDVLWLFFAPFFLGRRW